MNNKPRLSIVIPAYNEAERIGRTLERIGAFFESSGLTFEIIVVSDGSTDSTDEVVTTYARRNGRTRLISYSPNRGKGCAVRRGMIEARSENVLLTDADLATPIEDIGKLQEVIRGGYEVAVGSRALEESRVEGWRPWYRVLSGRIFNRVVQLLAVPGIHDTQCGFKLFSGGSATRIFSVSLIDGFGFDVESLYLARKLGYRIGEIPVRWSNSPSTKVSVMRDTLPMFCEVLQIRYNDWKRKYDRPTDGE
jgi:dolichyl-phosphate beta-glucosyltransferase